MIRRFVTVLLGLFFFFGLCACQTWLLNHGFDGGDSLPRQGVLP